MLQRDDADDDDNVGIDDEDDDDEEGEEEKEEEQEQQQEEEQREEEEEQEEQETQDEQEEYEEQESGRSRGSKRMTGARAGGGGVRRRRRREIRPPEENICTCLHGQSLCDGYHASMKFSPRSQLHVCLEKLDPTCNGSDPLQKLPVLFPPHTSHPDAVDLILLSVRTSVSFWFTLSFHLQGCMSCLTFSLAATSLQQG